MSQSSSGARSDTCSGPYSVGRDTNAVRMPRARAARRSSLWAATIMVSGGTRPSILIVVSYTSARGLYCRAISAPSGASHGNPACRAMLTISAT